MITANIARVTDLYGYPVKERWTVSFGDEITCKVRIMPPEGSKALCTLDDIEYDDVPDPVKQMLQEHMETVPEALRANL